MSWSGGIRLADWKSLAIAEAQDQGCDPNIVLATVEAETGGANKLGDSGNALGFGQVWPKWHNDAFVYAANKYRVTWPSALEDQQKVVLSHDGLSMAAAVYVIKRDWAAANQNFRSFCLMYVGPKIPDSDYNRRYNIWLKYQGGSYTGGADGAVAGLAAGGITYDDITVPQTNYGLVSGSQKLGNILYGRRYRILVSGPDGTALDVSQLRCTFNIQKTILQQPNFSEVVIYNLSPTTENSIIREGNRIVVEAGYEGDQYGLIFDGNVIQPIRDKEDGVTYRLTLRSLDGDRFYNQGTVGFSMLKGQSNRAIVENCVSKAKIPTQLGSISEGLANTKLTRGKVVFGLARDYLRQIAQSNNATFYLEDGRVNIVRATDPPQGEIFDLSPTSGLIGVPAQNDYGVQFRCLLNPRIKINSLVHIDNSLIRAQSYQLNQVVRNLDNDGIYRVIGVTYIGDTRGDEWYCECQTVSQAGMMPSMMTDPTANPN